MSRASRRARERTQQQQSPSNQMHLTPAMAAYAASHRPCHSLTTDTFLSAVAVLKHPTVDRSVREGRAMLHDATSGRRLPQRQQRLHNTLTRYSPPLHSDIVQCVAARVDGAGALSAAHRLRQRAQGGTVETFFRLLEEWRQQRIYESADGNLTAAEEEAAGILARLSLSGRQRLKASLHHASDVQVSEVLPNGRVVTLTEPTEPSATSPYTEGFRRLVGTSGHHDTLYLHFVLYRERMPLADAFRILAEATHGSVTVDDFSVNYHVEDGGVCTQTCSVRCHREESTADASYVRVAEALVQDLTQINWRPHGLAIQILGWRGFACHPANTSRSCVQYAVLLRGIQQHGQRLEAIVQRSALHFPNYYAASHFGPTGCPFRSYHVTAALAQSATAEALTMLVCLTVWDRQGPPPAWVVPVTELLVGEDDRPGAWREAYEQYVPARVRRHVAQAPAALVWNVVASCRVRELNVAGNDGLRGTALAGDFVAVRGEVTDSDCPVLRPVDDRTEASLTIPHVAAQTAVAAPQQVRALSTEDEATLYRLEDVLIPVDAAGVSEELAHVRHVLGLGQALSTPAMETAPDTIAFRPLLCRATGHPRSWRPWVREFTEPEEAIYMSTDLDLLAAGEDFTCKSRGVKAGLWPISKRGRPLTDRMPAGLLASIALSQRSNASRKSSRSVGIHVTLPAETYLTSFLREFVVVKNHSRTGRDGLGLNPQSADPSPRAAGG